MATEPGLRDRKKVATRRALTAAALRLAVEHGVDGVTVEDIAAAADVSTRTFFNYFPTKEAAFVADDLERGRRFVADIEAAPEDAPVWELLRRTALTTLATTELPSPEQALKEQLVRTSPAVLAEVLATFAHLEQELVVELTRRTPTAAPLHARLLANAVVAAVRAATETWLVSGGDAADYLALLDGAFTALSPAFPPTFPPAAPRSTHA
jgi:AcrR family transcriptional regulator